jgi:hypothetical protein
LPRAVEGAAPDVIEWLRKLAVDTHEGAESTLDEEALADAALELEGLRLIVTRLRSELDDLRASGEESRRLVLPTE